MLKLHATSELSPVGRFGLEFRVWGLGFRRLQDEAVISSNTFCRLRSEAMVQKDEVGPRASSHHPSLHPALRVLEPKRVTIS